MTDHSELVAELQARTTSYRLGGPSSEHTALLLDQAATALSSQSLSLSEAREEIERLRSDIAVKAKLLTKSAKETRAFWDALIPKGGRCRECADFDGRCQGDGPPCDPQAHALENLAKLQAASPDLSSLRKGAEIEKARQAVERLANVQMNISLEEWGELSNAILSALVSGSREDGDG